MVPASLNVSCRKVLSKSSWQFAVLSTEQEVRGQGGDGGVQGWARLVQGSSERSHPTATRVIRAKDKLLKLEKVFI